MTTEFGAPTDMVYKDTLRAEEYRRTVEQVDLFNAASGGAIMLESDPARQMALGGDFTDTARWKPVTSLISHRDNANPGTEVDVKKLEMTGGKLVRQTLGCGPVSVTDIQSRKAGREFDMNSAIIKMFYTQTPRTRGIYSGISSITALIVKALQRKSCRAFLISKQRESITSYRGRRACYGMLLRHI